MSYRWPDGTEIRNFSPAEFGRPLLMDMAFVRDLDDLRDRCGFPITVTDDARLPHDMARLYGPLAKWPDSGHLYRPAGWYKEGPGLKKLVPAVAHEAGARELPEYLCRAVDIKPGDTRTREELEERELTLAWCGMSFHKEGRWPDYQFELGTRHQHHDDYTWTGRLTHRPNIFAAVSR